MEDVTKLKISNVEKERLLIKNLNNRPNAMATYGQAKMSSAETKEVFDKQFELAVERHNKLCDEVVNLDETVTGFLNGTEDEEHKRRIAEMNRQTEETARVAAEKSRENNEQVRQENEQVRIDNESARKTAENARKEAESARKTAENARKEAESARETAEESRGQQFGDVAQAVDLIGRIQQGLGSLDGSVQIPSVDGSSCVEGYYYQGTGTGKNTLTFSFTPKVVFVIGKVTSYDSGNNAIDHQAFGVIFPQKNKMATFKRNNGILEFAVSHESDVYISPSGTSISLYDNALAANDAAKVFNCQSVSWANGEAHTEADGYGYWVYAIGDMSASPINNLAKNFEKGRLRSTGEITTSDLNHDNVYTCTDYIGPLKNGDVVRVQGFGALNNYNTVWYNGSYATYSSINIANTIDSNFNYSYDTDTGVVTITKTTDSVAYKYLRFSGIVEGGDTSKVVITLNEEIV